MTSEARADGGDGGDQNSFDAIVVGGTCGEAIANARAEKTVSGSGSVYVRAIANGGHIYRYAPNALGTAPGGDATAIAAAIAVDSPVEAVAEARGGAGVVDAATGASGSSWADATAITGGSAVATSETEYRQAEVGADPLAWTNSLAEGGTGSDARAEVFGIGQLASVVNRASAPVIAGSAEARATVGHAAPTLASLANRAAGAFTVALPDATEVANRLEANTGVAAGIDAGDDLLALVLLGAALPDNASTNSITLSSSSALSFDTRFGSLAPTLRVGLLDAELAGNGFDSLRFAVRVEGNDLVDISFTSLGEALAYFDDQLLDLGDWTSLPSADNVLDMTLALDLTTDDPSSGFRFDLLVATVPEPSIATLFGLAAVFLARRRRVR